MTFDLVVRGGRVVTAHEDFHADIGVTGGTIAAIGSGLRGAREIDASGKLVIPGAQPRSLFERAVRRMQERAGSDEG